MRVSIEATLHLLSPYLVLSWVLLTWYEHLIQNTKTHFPQFCCSIPSVGYSTDLVWKMRYRICRYRMSEWRMDGVDHLSSITVLAETISLYPYSGVVYLCRHDIMLPLHAFIYLPAEFLTWPKRLPDLLVSLYHWKYIFVKPYVGRVPLRCWTIILFDATRITTYYYVHVRTGFRPEMSG